MKHRIHYTRAQIFNDYDDRSRVVAVVADVTLLTHERTSRATRSTVLSTANAIHSADNKMIL